MKPILVSPIHAGDNITAPCRVVLHMVGPGEYATHLQNMQDKGLFWGHYHMSGQQAGQSISFAAYNAVKDFYERRKVLFSRGCAVPMLNPANA